MNGEEEDEEVIAEEVEAMKSVYENDCTILHSIPPHFHLSLKPRTAHVSSHQFVEIVLEVHATPQYPKEPPSVALVDCKGLDQHRQKHLLNHIESKAKELSPGLMLVALCEEAVEKLSDMNHPDGDCPLCLFPLVTEDHQNNREKLEEGAGNCPVCRKPFHAKDLEHVLDLVGSHSSRESLNNEVDNEENILQSEDEIIRKQRFEAILSLQKENNGLIEPKKDIVILPGMYLQQPVAVPDTTSTKEPDETEQHERDPPVTGSAKHVSGTSNGPSSSGNKNFGARKHRPRGDHHHSSSTARPRVDHHHSSSNARHPRKPVQQWVRKDTPSNKQ